MCECQQSSWKSRIRVRGELDGCISSESSRSTQAPRALSKNSSFFSQLTSFLFLLQVHGLDLTLVDVNAMLNLCAYEVTFIPPSLV